jgi:hypothetical protein
MGIIRENSRVLQHADQQHVIKLSTNTVEHVLHSPDTNLQIIAVGVAGSIDTAALKGKIHRAHFQSPV